MEFNFLPLQVQVQEKINSYGWGWLIGTILLIGLGVLLYMLIKKDPRRDTND
jgi:hypothetical protein